MSSDRTADLRALAERLDMLQPCEVCPKTLHLPTSCPACGAATGRLGHRLPTEAEVRAAIFESGWHRVEVWTLPEWVSVLACRGRVQRGAGAKVPEAAPDDLVLLALLRALEACRG